NSANGVLDVHGGDVEDMEAVNNPNPNFIHSPLSHPDNNFTKGVWVKDSSGNIGKDVIGAGVSKMIMVGSDFGGVSLYQFTPFGGDIALTMDAGQGTGDTIDIATDNSFGNANGAE